MNIDKQPQDTNDERAEWGGVCITTNPLKFEYSIPNEEADKRTIRFAPDDPKGAAGAKKPPMHLLPPDALLETARVLGFGAANYGPWNFINANVCAHTYIAAIGRHWTAYAKGQDIDPDSGLLHMAHIAANCFILMTAAQQGTLNDDRPKLKY